MYVCVSCKVQMLCARNEVACDFGNGHVYPGDAFRCPECGHGIISTNRAPIFDPERTCSVHYMTMNGRKPTGEHREWDYEPRSVPETVSLEAD